MGLYPTSVMTPASYIAGAMTPKVRPAPSSSDQPVRNDINAPAPSMSALPSSASVHSDNGLPFNEIGRLKVPGIRNGIHERLASRNHAMIAPLTPAMPSHRACFAPPSSFACRARIVSAVAVPVGKGSCSWLMSWRLMGIAANTPSAAMPANHKMRIHASGRVPVSITSAGSAAMLPPPVM